MTSTILRKLIWPAAAALGLIVAIAVPKPTAAVDHWFYVELWPGGSSTLTCGWHGGACYDDDSRVVSGAALDWAPSPSIAFSVKSNTSSSLHSTAGIGYVSSNEQFMCLHEVYVGVYDLGADWHAAADYLHTASALAAGTSWNIATGPAGVVSTTYPLGGAANESGCGESWSNFHVHQVAESWNLRSYPDHTTCNSPNILTDCWVGASYKQGDITWTISFP